MTFTVVVDSSLPAHPRCRVFSSQILAASLRTTYTNNEYDARPAVRGVRPAAAVVIHLLRNVQRLFPGVTPIALSIVALIPPVQPAALIYGAATAVAWDASLGTSGRVYPLLRAWLSPPTH